MKEVLSKGNVAVTSASVACAPGSGKISPRGKNTPATAQATHQSRCKRQGCLTVFQGTTCSRHGTAVGCLLTLRHETSERVQLRVVCEVAVLCSEGRPHRVATQAARATRDAHQSSRPSEPQKTGLVCYQPRQRRAIGGSLRVFEGPTSRQQRRKEPTFQTRQPAAQTMQV